jgi:hypothetical protein
VPWCEECSRFYNPNSLAPDGTCVHCGSFIAQPPAPGDEVAEHIPWHFWILIIALTVYLTWRAIQLAVWLAGKL